jgi:3',5'-cyclic AMP phosphodiesterase CpdA
MALRIVCISDTHGHHRELSVPAGDLLVHAGDLTRKGELDELRNLNAWLGTLPHPTRSSLPATTTGAASSSRSVPASCSRTPSILRMKCV